MRERILSGVFEGITVACYVVYRFYPLSTPLPERFPWPWWVSPVLAAVIGIPAVFSLVYFPIFLVLCFAEEQDLLWRYGEAYAGYCRRTGAFWPRRSRAQKEDS